MNDWLTLQGWLAAPWIFFVAAAVLVLGAGRAVRLITHDTFPPAEAARLLWFRITNSHKEWARIAICHWCCAPYVVAASIGWLVLGLLVLPWLTAVWWLVFSFAGLSYLVSLLVHWDEGKRL